MSILRIAGAVMVAISGICAAYFLNLGAKRSLRQTEAFISVVRFLRSQIECFSMSVPRALERCPREILDGCGYVGDTFTVYHRLYDLVGMTVLSDKNTVGFYDMNTVITVEEG